MYKLALLCGLLLGCERDGLVVETDGGPVTVDLRPTAPDLTRGCGGLYDYCCEAGPSCDPGLRCLSGWRTRCDPDWR